MLNRLSHTRLLRAAGLYTWALVGIPIILNVWFLPPSRGVDETTGSGINVPMTVVSYLAFGLCYWLATRSLGSRDTLASTRGNFVLLMVLTTAAVAVGYFTQTGLSAMLLLVMAGVLPWILSLRAAVAWLLLAHIPLVPSFMARDDFSFWEALFQSTFYVGFSAFVLVTAYVARQQAQARDEQRRLNAELRATRMLLAESARVNERTRISRELHDLLGHHLTALSLNLEVAGHMTEGRALEHVKQAHTLAKLLLTDVREVVSQLREGDAIDLGGALLLLTERVPALTIHMNIEEPLTLDDAERAHVLLRCTQEIITNAVRHAGAGNLWIHCRRDGGQIVIDAHDDGQGADVVIAGNGLRGMRERLRQHGGSMTIESRAGGGFRLCLRLPVETTEPLALELRPEPLTGGTA
ncbi:sensor histidine kinase [Pseudoxanthomonas sacheonensis]|uniref:sensor histidine kinase n=1 Tax=Pseudoxanthomonas sacheonensis TaxID=443615 RepID=UPI0013D372C9|nr:sensor histidine kinase [Pseudoxanthomonas sacheonensis]KAF1706944.1 two-component sensor histidine kinase [Pseudoxanthomonas sacheonensis]